MPGIPDLRTVCRCWLQRADRYAIVRSVTHTGVNHGTSAYHMLTGHIHFAPGAACIVAERLSSVVLAGYLGRQPRDMPAVRAAIEVLLDGDGGEVPGQGPGRSVSGCNFSSTAIRPVPIFPSTR